MDGIFVVMKLCVMKVGGWWLGFSVYLGMKFYGGELVAKLRQRQNSF